MRIPIAEDPDSWGKPADLERAKLWAIGPDGFVYAPAPSTTGYSLCPHCGATPNHVTQDLCPMHPTASDAQALGLAGGSGI